MRYLLFSVVLATLLVSSACIPRNVESPVLKRHLNEQRNSLGQKFVELPGGDFLMGHAEHRGPVHTVTVSAYWIASTEVTNRQYDQLVKGHIRPTVSLKDDDPVTGITRSQAEHFAWLLSKKEKRTYRLPTDAEWEYAARGGLVGKDFPWGDSQDIKSFCNSGISDGTHVARRVGSYPPNGFGLFDMVGNASEWILDTELDFPSHLATSTEVDPLRVKDKSVWLSRGGSFSDWYPFVWRASPSAILNDREEDLCSDVGFRLVLVND